MTTNEELLAKLAKLRGLLDEADDTIDALREQIARLTAPASESDLEMAAECRKEGRRIYNREHAKRSLIDCENEAIARAIAQTRRQGREQRRKEALATLLKEARGFCGDDPVTEDEIAGFADGIAAAIRALPLDPPGGE